MAKLWTGTDGKLILTDCPDCPCSPTIRVCGCDILQTLFVTFTAAGCAALNGMTFPITAPSIGPQTWAGTFSLAGCADMTFYYQVTDSCNVYMWIKRSGATVWGSSITACTTFVECPLVSDECTHSANTLGACAIPLMSCSGNLTATVTP